MLSQNFSTMNKFITSPNAPLAFILGNVVALTNE